MRKKGSKDNYSMICGTKYKDLFEYEKEKDPRNIILKYAEQKIQGFLFKYA